MRNEDALAVIDILETADGGCPPCVQSLFQKFGERFPQFQELVQTRWGVYGKSFYGDDVEKIEFEVSR